MRLKVKGAMTGGIDLPPLAEKIFFFKYFLPFFKKNFLKILDKCCVLCYYIHIKYIIKEVKNDKNIF